MERTDFEHWNGKEVARLLALVETERRYYQEMVATLPVALAVLAADRSVVSANRAFRQLFGLSLEDLRRKPIEHILPSDRLIEKIRDLNVNAIPQPGFLLELSGKLLRIALLPIRNWDDEMEMESLVVIEDVTGIRSGEPAPAVAPPLPVTAPAALSFPTEDVPAALWRADASTFQFNEVSGTVHELLGYPAEHWLVSGDFFAQRIHPEDRDATLAHYRSAVEQSHEASAEFRAIAATGETIWCRETIRVSEPGILTGVCFGITERKQLERRNVAAERTAALQGLSARLAHDLNNPLMIVTGYAEEMLHGMAPDDPRRENVEQILAATLRMEGITSQMLRFTRRHADSPQSVDLGVALSEMAASLARIAGEGVTVDVLPAEAVWASVNRKQFEEIVLALVAATSDDTSRTRITIVSDTAAINEFIGGGATGLKPGTYARVIVRDDGHGMDAEKIPGVFESFLAKEPAATGQNAPFALSHAYGIVREWGGDIGFDSEPSRGSTFTLYLPLAEPAPVVVEPPPVVIEQPSPAPPLPEIEPRRETILVVDDEPGIRALVAKILRRERYIVLEAGSANEAMTVALIHGAPIQLLLTDIMLPDRSGRQIAQQFYESVPGIKVLYVSGFTDDESVRTGDFPPGSRFLQKPFTLGALVGTVREALDS
jgi:PAS domain S-box-containing protein